MEVRTDDQGVSSWNAEGMIALVCEGQAIADAVAEVCPWVRESSGLEDFKGKSGEIAVYYGKGPIPRLICAGLGKLDNLGLPDIRDAIGQAVKKCRSLDLTSVILPAEFLEHLPGGRDRLIEECVYSACIALYQFTEYKTKNENGPGLDTLILGLRKPDQGIGSAVKRGHIAARAVTMARNLANMPGNALYPQSMARFAADTARENGLRCEILDEQALAGLGCGGILGVGSGSCHPPRLITLEYAPEGHEQAKPLIFIGKGITFDSGGLCLKPAANMFQMKCDMSGAASVLAVMAVCGALSVSRRIIGILACAENMPDGRAYRPGDILKMLNGETVEVINTDAEGRLVLADALSYAQKNWTPAAIVDIATLTGACAVALGNDLAGLFGENDELCYRILNLGKVSGENYWRLPLWEPYVKSLKSEVADLKHTASREGGAITAALFLKNFVESGNLWAHLDIAGVDWSQSETALRAEGATGYGTRTLLGLAMGGIE